MHILYTIIIFPIEQIIELSYIFVYRVFHDSVLALLGVSTAVSILTRPLYFMAEKQQQAERDIQARMKNKVNTIKAVFQGDERFMLLAVYYRQNGYHPIYSLRSSISIIIQIPFFIAAYHFLHGLALLEGQSFLFIKDLSAPDALLYGVNILPILMTLINGAAGAVYTKGFDLKDKLRTYAVSAVFLLLLYNSPSGLVLYWTSNNVYNLIKIIAQKNKYAEKIIRVVVFAAGIALSAFVFFVNPGTLNLKRRILSAALLLFLAGIPLWKKILYPAASLLKQQWCRRISFSLKADAKTFALSCGILFLLIGLVIPSALISSSAAEFYAIDDYVHPFSLLQNILLQSAGLFLFWGFFIYFLSDAKTKSLLPAAAALLAVLALINTFVFKGNYGTITELLEFSKIETPGMVRFLINPAVNIAAAVLFVFVCIPRKKTLDSLLAVTLISCMAFGIINTLKIYRITATAGVKSDSVIFPEPEYTFSQTGKNVLLIMLDRAFSGYVPAILEEKPELRDIFSGFVFYSNTVSFAGFTVTGAPPLYGGYEYTPLEMNRRDTVPLVDKHNEALLLLPKLFLDKGFMVSITDMPWANYNYVDSLDFSVFDNSSAIHAAGNRKYTAWLEITHQMKRGIAVIKQVLYNDLIRFSFFRAAPPLFRNFIYDAGDYLDMQKDTGLEPSTVENRLAPATVESYAALDVLPKITGITEENIFVYNTIYNELPHEPAFFQFPDYDIAEEVSRRGDGPYSDEKHYHANMASWLLLAKWFQYLKDNGVYDNTRIIIAADHGLHESKIYTSVLPNGEYLQGYTPLLLFKDFDAEGPLRTDTAFMTNADVPLLALNGLVDNPVNPFTGKPLKTVKQDGVTITTSNTWKAEQHGKFRFTIKPNQWLHVQNDIFDINNWKLKEHP